MSAAKIEKATVDMGIAAARDALANEPGLAWVTRSSLLERAYFSGLYVGLSAIAEDSEKVLSRLLIDTLYNTLYPRGADDSFDTTSTGKAFAALKQHLTRPESDQVDSLEAMQGFADHIDGKDCQWNSGLRHTRDLLDQLRTMHLKWSALSAQETTKSPERQNIVHDLVEKLEKIARFIALTETDHRRWKCVEE
jgi:hypothetical protein